MLLFLALSSPLAQAADRAAAIVKLQDSGRSDQAKERCDKWHAQEAVDEPGLREVCARLSMPAPEEDNVDVLHAFSERWRGTEAADKVAVQEASAAFRHLGTQASTQTIQRFIKRYPDAQEVPQAAHMLLEAGVREVDTPEAALAFVRSHPHHPGLHRLVARYPDAFIHAEVRHPAIVVRLLPDVILPPELAPTSQYVLAAPDGSTRPWLAWAKETAVATGVPEALLSDDAFQAPCWDPAAHDATPQIEVTLGSKKVLIPSSWSETCPASMQPTWFAFHQEELVDVRHGENRLDPKALSDEAFTSEPPPTGPLMVHEKGLWRQRAKKNLAWHPFAGGNPVSLDCFVDECAPQWEVPVVPGMGLTPEDVGWQSTTTPEGVTLTQGDQTIAFAGADTVRAWWWSPLITDLVHRADPLQEVALPSSPPLDKPGTVWMTDRMGYLDARPPKGATSTPCQTSFDTDFHVKRVAERALGAGVAQASGCRAPLSPALRTPNEEGLTRPPGTLEIGSFLHEGEWHVAVVLASPTGSLITQTWNSHTNRKPDLFTFRVGDDVYVAARGLFSPGADHFASYLYVARIHGGSIAIEYLERWI